METSFKETQRFNQIWLLILLGLFSAILIVAMYNGIMQAYIAKDMNSFYTLFGISFLEILVVILILNTKLYTEIDEMGITVQMKPFHLKPKFFPWDEIESVEVRKYKPMAEYGGWGLRIGLNGTAYNIKGNMGLQIYLKNEKKILIGTQKSDELNQYLISNRKI